MIFKKYTHNSGGKKNVCYTPMSLGIDDSIFWNQRPTEPLLRNPGRPPAPNSVHRIQRALTYKLNKITLKLLIIT